jgi:hypothetical protein
VIEFADGLDCLLEVLIIAQPAAHHRNPLAAQTKLRAPTRIGDRQNREGELIPVHITVLPFDKSGCPQSLCSTLRKSLRRPEGNDCSPQQLKAARSIVAICAENHTESKEIVTARAECFRLLTALKETSQFRWLQQHIDISLDNKGAQTKLKIEREVAATTSAIGCGMGRGPPYSFRRTS